MMIVIWTAAVLAALIHILFFCFESLWWMKPTVYRRFRISESEARTNRLLAFNQGFYNLFLALGTLAGLWLFATGRAQRGATLLSWTSLSMLGAALVLAFSSPKMLRGALIQGLPPLIAFVGLMTAGQT